MNSVGSIQVCAGHEAGCESIVHAMRSIFEDESADAVLLVGATNAFNSVNRQTFLLYDPSHSSLLMFVDYCAENSLSAKIVDYADNSTAAGKLNDLKRWGNKLNELGPKLGYHPNATKTSRITKDSFTKKHGQRHLGAVIGSSRFNC